MLFYTTQITSKKFKEKLRIVTERKLRKLVTIDETVVKVNGENYYVYAVIDIEKNNSDESLSFEKVLNIFIYKVNIARINLNLLLIKSLGLKKL